MVIMGFFSSCQDAIDIQQPGLLLADNAFQNVDDLKLGLLGVYSQFDNTIQIRFNALYTDELSIGLVNGGQGISEYALSLNPTSDAPSQIWTTYYIAIANINKFIAAGNDLVPAEGEETTYKNILGQAYALRAYAHFELQTYFTTDYSNDSALGVIALDYVPTLDAQIARNTNGEVFDFINADLDTASDLILDNSDVRTFVNKDFVTALRARMAAYRGKYTLADTYASQLLTEYPIANQVQFFNMWEDTDNTEMIFKFERSKGDPYDAQGTDGFGYVGSMFAFSTSTIDGSPFFEMSRSLFNKLPTDDIRYIRYVDPSSLISPDYETTGNYRQEDVLVIRKYPGSENQALMNDLKIFRSAEMLLIKAEALADANDLGGAAGLIKQLRDARFGSAQALPSYANQTAAFGDILDERRVELALEGHRWVDIKRLGVKGNRTIDRYSRDCAINNVCTISNTDYRFTMPIPLREIDQDPLLVQNPGY